jgi:hypothetical protein
VARYRRVGTSSFVKVGAQTSLHGRHIRSPWSLPIFAFATSISFVLAAAVDPTAAHAMLAGAPTTVLAPVGKVQSITVAEGTAQTITRDEFGVSKVVVYGKAPAAGIPDPGTAQAIAYEIVQTRGWGDDQYSCLVSLWNKESRWNVYSHNVSSGAYGIPQALPGIKMASAGEDWETNPRTQIVWGLGYIQGRYETPCGAWAMSQQRGWY